MADIRDALDHADALDGPPEPGATFHWLRARDGVLPDPEGRVAVMALRTNDSRLGSDDCAIIARVLEAVVRDPRWDAYARARSRSAEHRRLLAGFASFCAEAATTGGCVEGDGSHRARPYAEVLRAPTFHEDPAIGERIASRCAEAAVLAKEQFGEALSLTIEGLAALDRVAGRTANPAGDESNGDDDAIQSAALCFAAYAGECLRRLHDGVWGRVTASQAPALRLASGAVVPLMMLRTRFFDRSPRPPPFSLEEYGRFPVQMP